MVYKVIFFFFFNTWSDSFQDWAAFTSNRAQAAGLLLGTVAAEYRSVLPPAGTGQRHCHLEMAFSAQQRHTAQPLSKPHFTISAVAFYRIKVWLPTADHHPHGASKNGGFWMGWQSGANSPCLLRGSEGLWRLLFFSAGAFIILLLHF